MLAMVAYALRMAGSSVARPAVSQGPVAGLLIVSAVTGVLVLLVFRYTANQRRLRRSKDRIQGALLGVVLFRHDTAVMFGEEKRLVLGAVAYLLGGLVPLAAAIVPMMAIFAPLVLFYSYRPLLPGEQTILTVRAAGDGMTDITEVSLEAPDGIEIETPALRIPASGEVCWRISGRTPGGHEVRVRIGDRSYPKSVRVAEDGKRALLSPSRVRTGFFAALFDSGERLMARDAPLQRIDVRYPPAPTLRVGPWRLHWVVWFMVGSMLVAILLKGYLKVEL